MAKPNIAGTAHQYEVAVILNPALDEKKSQALISKYLKVVEEGANGKPGTVEKSDFWGKKSLAYEIQNHKEGFYVIVNFTADSDTTNEFARRLGLDESVIRYKVFRKNA